MSFSYNLRKKLIKQQINKIDTILVRKLSDNQGKFSTVDSQLTFTCSKSTIET